MSNFKHNELIIIPANKRAAVNDALENIGYGPNNFSVPIVPTTNGQGTPPPTHYAASIRMTDDVRARVLAVLDTLNVNAGIKDLRLKKATEHLADDGNVIYDEEA